MLTLDLQGLKCPEPVMMTRNKVRKMAGGTSIKIVADDESTTRDIPAFCRHMDHKLISAKVDKPPYEFVIEKC
ncbi:sulfurtransferase TusA [Vibrio sp. PNB22_3_1]